MRNSIKKEMIGEHQVTVFLPPSYKDGGRYPVAYLQDGSELIDYMLNWLQHLFMTKALPEVILVGIEPINRNNEYTPWPAKALLSTYPDFGGQGDAYLGYVTGILKPQIDASYRTLPDAEHTAMIGASLGGLISLYAAYRHPDVFGRIGALSASFWYEGFLEFVRESPPPSANQKLFMYVGSKEGVHKQNIQANMVPYTHEAYKALVNKGCPSDRLIFVEEEGGTHDGVFFAKHMPEAISWLFS
ncbi:Predicted hydrolase of the alpha/beta superfamily [Paenibacillus sp. UNCCL117]|uniref:alpha/beta hydrolase n=1 Tax=unclassified Paenibacillus TaxID=185978 RepID=UPI000882CAA2|nr:MULTISPECIES: alpha/beta hydrolase-fold protein [unclassified Paenibacillus]SDD40665.1 Predicted hydrolase of the alpha/beta superfamily [Paenibacillus sp. cl123]SFW48037.1 Predicted hydrolase of the alpha/beta superfamily [Paenibacillus sp. UNCCL117]